MSGTPVPSGTCLASGAAPTSALAATSGTTVSSASMTSSASCGSPDGGHLLVGIGDGRLGLVQVADRRHRNFTALVSTSMNFIGQCDDFFEGILVEGVVCNACIDGVAEMSLPQGQDDVGTALTI